MNYTAAWFAGLFEGEGFISIHKERCHVRVGVKMTDLDILQRFQARYGGQLTPATKNKSSYKDTYEWRLGKRKEVIAFLEELLPWFGERRAYQCANAFDRLDFVW